MSLGRYLLIRLITGLMGLLVFASVVWALATWLLPGDFTSNFAGISGEQQDAIREGLGLNRPLLEQYLDFIGGILRFDLGETFEVRFTATGVETGGARVTDLVLNVLPWTVTLFALAIGLGLALGLPIGRRIGWTDHSVSPMLIAAATAASIFPPWMAIVIANVGFSLIGITMYDRLRQLDQILWDTPPSPVNVLWGLVGGVALAAMGMVWIARHTRLGRFPWLRWVGLPLLLGVVIGGWWAIGLVPRLIDLVGFIALPLLALGLTMTGEVVLVVAAAMAGTAKAPYSAAARAKGLSPRMIRRRHAGRATLLPAISRMAASLPVALGSLVIVEYAFASLGARSVHVEGLSSIIFFTGLQQRNTPLAVGAVIAIGVIALVIRLALDVVHVALDPRIETEAPRA